MSCAVNKVLTKQGFKKIFLKSFKLSKEAKLSPLLLLPVMQEIQGNLDDVLSRNDLRDDGKANRCFQLQNRYLAFKEQLNTRKRPKEIISTVPDLSSSTRDSSAATAALSSPLIPDF